MKRLFVPLVAMVAAASLMVAGCTQAAPAPSPTQAPAAATKAPAAPTKAPAAPTTAPAPTKAAAPQPTAAPAKKVDFPQKGKTITLAVNQTAGGATDIQARLMADALQKELGVSVVVVNKPGATGQVGTADLVNAKPDGYTIGTTNLPSTLTNYLDPSRKSTFGRKDLQQVANHVVDPETILVKADSPFKSLKDLVDAAKAKPGEIRIADSGLLGNNHLASSIFRKVAGIELTDVHFNSGVPAMNALLGGNNVDCADLTLGAAAPQYKSKDIRYLGIMAEKPNPLAPEVPTFESQGYKVYFASSRGYSVPAGTPKEVVDILAAAMKRAMESDSMKQKMDELFLPQLYMGPGEYTAYWDDLEAKTKPVMEEILRAQK